MSRFNELKIITNSKLYVLLQITLFLCVLYFQNTTNYTNLIYFISITIYLLLLLRIKYLKYSLIVQLTLFILSLIMIFPELFLFYLLKLDFFKEGFGLQFVFLYPSFVSLLLFIFILVSFFEKNKKINNLSS